MTRREDAHRLRKEGKTVPDIANILSCAKSTAYTWTKGIPVPEGIKERGRKRAAATKQANMEVPEQVSKVELSGHTRAIGDATQLVLLAKFALQGYVVLLPYGDNLRYDLALDLNGKLCRVQCKTGRLKNGGIRFNTSSANSSGRKTYTSDEIDMFGVYCPELDKCYLIPISMINNASTCTLRVYPTRNRQTRHIRWAKEFEL